MNKGITNLSKTLLLIPVFCFACKSSKDSTSSLLEGKWICVSDVPYNKQHELEDEQLPCVYDLIFEGNKITFLNFNGDNGTREIKIINDSIYVNDKSFKEVFEIMRNTTDTLVLVRSSSFSNYKKPLSQMIFIKENN